MQRISITNRAEAVDIRRFEHARYAPAASLTRLVWRRRVAKVTRWLHIYGSMASLALVLFFAITGVTLNHQEWFAGQQVTAERHGTLNPAWLRTGQSDSVDKLQVVEYLRSAAGVRGALADVRIDGDRCEVVFKGPGYEATALVERTSGKFDLTETRMGFAAIINDLHKGRDSGGVWKAAIDVAAGVLVFISLTGLILLYFVHKYRLAGAILAGAGVLASYIVYAIWVP